MIPSIPMLEQMGYRQPEKPEDEAPKANRDPRADAAALEDDIWARLGQGFETLGRRIDQGIRNAIDSVAEEAVIDGDVDYDVPENLRAHVKGNVNGDVGKSLFGSGRGLFQKNHIQRTCATPRCMDARKIHSGRRDQGLQR